MLFTDAIPLRVLRIAEIPIAPHTPRADTTSATRQEHQEDIHPTQVIQVPPSIPGQIIQIVDPPSVGSSGGDSGRPPSTAFGIGGHGDSEISDLFNFRRSISPSITPSPVKRWRVSGGVEQGLLIQDVKPIYPALARRAGVQGAVVLQAVIGKDGRIENLRVVSGNPLLVKAAMEAVKQWRYRPYLLNGEPVEVETQVTINFIVS
jgi:protein TonB